MALEDLCKSRDLTQYLGGCDFELGVPDYVIFTPRDIKITAVDAEDLITFLREKSDHSIDSDKRYHPVYGQIKRITDQSTEATVGTLDKGYSRQLLPGRAIQLFEWPSSVASDRHIYRLNGFKGGCLIINSMRLLIGMSNIDGSMGAIPVADVGVSGGGFSGSGGDIQTVRMMVDFGSQDQLVAGVTAYQFKDTDRFENIYPEIEETP